MNKTTSLKIALVAAACLAEVSHADCRFEKGELKIDANPIPIVWKGSGWRPNFEINFKLNYWGILGVDAIHPRLQLSGTSEAIDVPLTMKVVVKTNKENPWALPFSSSEYDFPQPGNQSVDAPGNYGGKDKIIGWDSFLGVIKKTEKGPSIPCNAYLEFWPE